MLPFIFAPLSDPWPHSSGNMNSDLQAFLSMLLHRHPWVVDTRESHKIFIDLYWRTHNPAYSQNHSPLLWGTSIRCAFQNDEIITLQISNIIHYFRWRSAEGTQKVGCRRPHNFETVENADLRGSHDPKLFSVGKWVATWKTLGTTALMRSDTILLGAHCRCAVGWFLCSSLGVRNLCTAFKIMFMECLDGYWVKCLVFLQIEYIAKIYQEIR